jgi:thiamine-monophosphate kinase
MKRKPHSEDQLLKLIQKELPPPSSDVLVGIGDDCAVIKTSPIRTTLTLLKTDAVVGGIHFLPETPLTQVGWKALCRPISDIAAMGGTPLHATITVAAPASWGNAEWRALYRGLGKAAHSFNVSIVGGETVKSPGPLFLSIALIGSVEKKNIRMRSAGNPDDLLCVTGKLGGSLKSGRHLRFHPRLSEGQWLAAERGVMAMMDLSDGLGSDLPKLATASKCAFRIVSESLPLHQNCTINEAITDGEDYELLVSITPKLWPDLQSRWEKIFPKLPLTVIGSLLTSQESSTQLLSGYDHFKEALI